MELNEFLNFNFNQTLEDLTNYTVAGRKSSKILIFDIDDTLIYSNANIIVRDAYTGKYIRTLSSSEFNTYKLLSGESFDFSEFDDEEILCKAKMTKYWATLRREYNRGTHIGIITARGNENAVYNYFAKNGFTIKRTLIYTVGDPAGGINKRFTGTVAERKQHALRQLYSKGYRTFIFFDDNRKNLLYAKSLSRQFADMTIHTVHIRPDMSSCNESFDMLLEGGNAIKDASRVSRAASAVIINDIKRALDASSIEYRLLGSTGKITDEQTTGDIDIAVSLKFDEENVIKLRDILYKYCSIHISDEKLSKGLRLYSIGYSYGNDKIAQVDFMFTTDINYSDFMYHSPNYVNHESNFKGLFRTNLLVLAASKAPLPDDEKYATEYYNDGEIKTYWKYSLSYEEGLRIVHKSYIGKKIKRLAHSVTIKEDTEFITKDIHKILYILFGPDMTVDDCNSFESLVDFICSDRYKYRTSERLQDIFDSFFEDYRHQPDKIGDSTYQQLQKYIADALRKNRLL